VCNSSNIRNCVYCGFSYYPLYSLGFLLFRYPHLGFLEECPRAAITQTWCNLAHKAPLTGVRRPTNGHLGTNLCTKSLGPSVLGGTLSIHVPCMQLPLKTLTLTGLSAFQDSLLVPRPDVLSTRHTWVLRDLGLPFTSKRFTDN